jgi:alkylation response protein AidB-like acyl-CoA dehydrogenase
MDFRLSPDAEAFRAEIRVFLEEAMTPELEERLYRTGVSNDEGFTRDLVERGWFAPDWPASLGGQDRSPMEVVALDEELQRVDAPLYLSETTRMVAALIRRLGSPAMRERVLPGALRGEITIALGFTEPSCGSDLAAAVTKAARDGDEWVINGQKMFTTNGHVADYVFLLARTNADVPKHRGLTTFLVPLKGPGVTVQALYTLSGERTNITFYTDVRIGDEWRIGEIDGGWAVMALSLQDEHTSGWGQHLARLLHHAEEWARSTAGEGGRPRLNESDVRRRLARVAAEVEVSILLERRGRWMAEEGPAPVAEGPMSKLYSTEALQRAAEDILEMAGPDALRSRFQPSAPQGGRLEHMLRFAMGTTIYAGTSEVQRGIIAHRGLGLPR